MQQPHTKACLPIRRPPLYRSSNCSTGQRPERYRVRRTDIYHFGTSFYLRGQARRPILAGKAMRWRYVDENRIGDHICYYSDLRKMRSHYPAWDITRKLDDIFEEIAAGWVARLAAAASR